MRHRHARSTEKGHGRVEIRELRTTEILTRHQDWAGLARGFEITRTRRVKGETTTEIVYGITSLSSDRADADQLMEAVRQHWGIENKLHYVRDVTLKEDLSRVRCGSAPQVLAGLRNAVVHLIRDVEAESRPAAIEMLNAKPDQAMELLGLPPFQ